MADQKFPYVVLKYVEGKEGYMGTFVQQVASIVHSESAEQAVLANVGTFPEYDSKGGKPFRTVAILLASWKEFDVHGDSVAGVREFVAYPAVEPIMSEATDG